MGSRPKDTDSAKPFWRRIPHRILLSIILLSATFEPLNFWPLAFVAFVPWMDDLAQTPDWPAAIRRSVLFSCVFSLFAFVWVAYVLQNFGGLPWPLAALALVLFTFIAEPQIYLLAPWVRFLAQHSRRGDTKRTFLAGLALSASYAAMDTLFPKLFTDTLGHALLHSETLVQIADLGGPALLTFLCFLGNVAIWQLWQKIRDRSEPSLWGSLQNAYPLPLTFLILLGGSILYGKDRLVHYRGLQASPERKMEMAIIQANIGDLEKVAAETRSVRTAVRKVMDTYYELNERALAAAKKPEVLLWPETAYPSTFQKPETPLDQLIDQELVNYVQSRGVPIFFGGYDRDEVANSYNSVFLYEPSGRLQTYHKSILIMFGEYIPGADWVPGLKEAFPMVGYFGKGPGPVTRELLGVPVQPIICYEALFPNFISSAVKRGARVVMNFTNDSWFGSYGAPHYHFKFARLRSIESRVPQVRTTNTGFSGLILPSGDVVSKSSLFEPEVIPVSVPIIETSPTLMVRWGDWFRYLALIMALGLGGLLWNQSRRRPPSAG